VNMDDSCFGCDGVADVNRSGELPVLT